VEVYLEDVFKKLPQLAKEDKPSFAALLPWNWKKNLSRLPADKPSL